MKHHFTLDVEPEYEGGWLVTWELLIRNIADMEDSRNRARIFVDGLDVVHAWVWGHNATTDDAFRAHVTEVMESAGVSAPPKMKVVACPEYPIWGFPK
jgi:hypothetical protein